MLELLTNLLVLTLSLGILRRVLQMQTYSYIIQNALKARLSWNTNMMTFASDSKGNLITDTAV